MNKSPCYLSTLLLGSTRGCPPFSHMWAQRHSCPEHYALQHLLMTKEGAVYTYFYSSIKRWPANKKKNQAHLVLCAECPQINRIRRVFSPHVKISRKNWHWMCTSILRSWNRVLPKSNVVSRSWQLLASHFHFLQTVSILGWRCGRNIIPLNGIFLKWPQEIWQRQGDSRQVPLPPLSLSSPCSGAKGYGFQMHWLDTGLNPMRSHWWIRHLWR